MVHGVVGSPAREEVIQFDSHVFFSGLKITYRFFTARGEHHYQEFLHIKDMLGPFEVQQTIAKKVT